jgi:hypothetical protein
MNEKFWKVTTQEIPSQGGWATMYHVYSIQGEVIALNLTQHNAQQIVRDHNAAVSRMDAIDRFIRCYCRLDTTQHIKP